MAIGNAIEHNGLVQVYDERGQMLFTRRIGSDITDGLKGYTSSTVSIRHGAITYMYNAAGQQTGAIMNR
jgi:hypothetical protein